MHTSVSQKSEPQRRIHKQKKVLRRQSLQVQEKQPKPVSPLSVSQTDKTYPSGTLEKKRNCSTNDWCYKENLNAISNHGLFTLVDAFLSFWVLLVPPFKDIFIDVDADPFLLVCTICIFVFFILEIVMLSIGQEKYFLGTYFWLDVLATASLVIDMFPKNNFSNIRYISNDRDQLELPEINRYAQILGRLGRTVRLLRLFRQLRVIQILGRSFNDEKNEDLDPAHGGAEKLVASVSDRMSRRVVVIILVSVTSLMLLQQPQLDFSREESIRLLASVARNGTTTRSFNDTLTKFLSIRERVENGRLLSLSIHNKTFKSWSLPPEVQQDELRDNQWEKLVITEADESIIASFDLRPEVATQAKYDIGIIGAVTFILIFFAFLLSWDSVQLIRGPFQKMLRAETLSKALLRFFKKTAQSDDINVVSRSVVETSQQLLRCQSVHLYFIDKVSKTMICRHSCNMEIKSRKSIRGTMNRISSFGSRSNITTETQKRHSDLGETFSISLEDEKYLSVLVANTGKSTTQENVLCYNGKEYRCKNVLVIPVMDSSKKVVAIVEAVNKRFGEFTEKDMESMKAFSEQMSAVVSRRAYDAVYSSILSEDSGIDDTARSLLTQYSLAKIHNEDDVKTNRGHFSAARNNSMIDDLFIAKGSDNTQLHDQITFRKEHLESADGKIGKYLDWNTNLFEMDVSELQFAVVALLTDLGLLAEFQISRNTMLNFLEVVANSYLPKSEIPYHNFYHGFNVFQVCTIMIHDTHLSDHLERCDILALLLGSICHDIGHKGVNNQFHKAMYRKDPILPQLALTYNDASVLENMHCSKAFKITTEEGCNIFSKLTKAKEFEVRRMMIKGILATDMEFHFSHVKKLQSKTNFEIENRQDRTFLVEISMHTSDLNNPTQPWENSKRWARAVAQEFVDQVKLERQYGLPVSSHMDLQGEFDENNSGWAKLNISFTEYLVKGLLEAFCDFFPAWNPRMEEMEKNLAMWKRIAGKKQIMHVSDTKEVGSAASKNVEVKISGNEAKKDA
jgi:hypothetical protein